MTPEELEAIERRAEAATEGPWNGPITVTDGSLMKDVEFIKHSRTDIPALCAALREAWAENERLKREVGATAKTCAEYANRIKELEGKS